MEYEILQVLKRIESILNKIEERQRDMEDELKFIKQSYETECGPKFIPDTASCRNCIYSTASGYEEPCNSCENYSNWKYHG